VVGAAGARRSGDRGPVPLSLSRYPRVLPVGDAAVTLELGDAIDPELNARVRAMDAALAERPCRGLRESVPAYASLQVLFDPALVTAREVTDRLLDLAAHSDQPVSQAAHHIVPVVYGGEAGPDLDGVARHCGIEPREIVSLHGSREYTAYFVGFTPGFAYLGPLPEAMATPRRATPRVRVPAGAVAIAGRQTAIYPKASPGGWNLIGRTAVGCFDPTREPPALIAAGDRVHFVSVDALDEPPPSAPAEAGPVDPVLEVVDGGLLTTVQDRGRPGLRRYGVPRAGALDPHALARANRAVGNAADEAGLECTIAGPTLRFLRSVRFAWSGADLGATLEREDLGSWRVPADTAVLARAGNELRFSGRRSGCRAYLALAGGLDVPRMLGSRATDLTGGFGGLSGRGLRTGDRLGIRSTSLTGSERELDRIEVDPPLIAVTLRVVPGPQADHFATETIARFLAETWRIGATSDRVGCRLDGEPLAHSASPEIVTDGMIPGCVQVPPDGMPILMLADAPTTGGYPKIATVIEEDLARVAQLVPGEGRVRFEPRR
jgi:KipI family sensor histidine kinase inhibitor